MLTACTKYYPTQSNILLIPCKDYSKEFEGKENITFLELKYFTASLAGDYQICKTRMDNAIKQQTEGK